MGGDRFLVSADARVFLGRLVHLDPAAVVRLRPSGGGHTGDAHTGDAHTGDVRTGDARTAVWGRLPWGVLVTRDVARIVPYDVTVGAAALLRAGDALPERRDAHWRWPLPPDAGAVVEEVPARRLRELAAAAAGTLREVARAGMAGRPVGARMLREALLDHVAVVVEAAGVGRLEIPQRLVQAVVRMGFLGSGDVPVRVRSAQRWVGLAARYGTAWLPPAGLAVRPARPHRRADQGDVQPVMPDSDRNES